ncbi:MAG: hypothetical protein COT71_00945 [Candidatus Andersenbacteria bacterium CG10_big_fil_rev_8_21_14_0_10_54_11]|uniref:Uncharacterized protein n=1 Tax=Candidatus Andersenbacteria bacterium CG10_big_fil_rev_8_21_14_0_10_54_11 TaxID=1974485 RepID=A0A2M6X040_9BACT|nr:MAG: hypothetical protein COT71_00945 [Candidatus Andersenbacteria bacterium CG10_big_fil_rev_8_21_14_0_10_54_11]
MNNKGDQEDQPQSKSALYLGLGIIGAALLFFVVFLGIITGRSGALNSSGTSGASIYLDSYGRIDVGGELQVDGPAAVPVNPGTYTITFIDAAPAAPAILTVAEGEFRYVPPPRQSDYPGYSSPGAAKIRASAFPPGTRIEILACQIPNAAALRTCQLHPRFNQDLLPGTYTVRYTEPALGAHEETITLAAGEDRSISHSFITTVAEWDTWRAAYGHTLPRPRRSTWPRAGAEDILLLPFWVVGEVVEDVFD